MNYLQRAITSKTIWLILLIFIVGGVQAIQEFLNPQVFVFLTGALSLLTAYFKLNPSQEYLK